MFTKVAYKVNNKNYQKKWRLNLWLMKMDRDLWIVAFGWQRIRFKDVLGNLYMWSDPEPGCKNSHMFTVIDKISKYLFAKKEVAFLVREVPQGLSSNHEGCVNATFGDIKYKFVFLYWDIYKRHIRQRQLIQWLL